MIVPCHFATDCYCCISFHMAHAESCMVLYAKHNRLLLCMSVFGVYTFMAWHWHDAIVRRLCFQNKIYMPHVTIHLAVLSPLNRYDAADGETKRKPKPESRGKKRNRPQQWAVTNSSASSISWIIILLFKDLNALLLLLLWRRPNRIISISFPYLVDWKYFVFTFIALSLRQTRKWVGSCRWHLAVVSPRTHTSLAKYHNSQHKNTISLLIRRFIGTNQFSSLTNEAFRLIQSKYIRFYRFNVISRNFVQEKEFIYQFLRSYAVERRTKRMRRVLHNIFLEMVRYDNVHLISFRTWLGIERPIIVESDDRQRSLTIV